MGRPTHIESTLSPRPPIAVALLLPILLVVLGAVLSAAAPAGAPTAVELSAHSSPSPEPLAVVGGTLVDGTGACTHPRRWRRHPPPNAMEDEAAADGARQTARGSPGPVTSPSPRG